ncbi:MAG TPA: DUF924 family protein [Sphingomicrobium sp.]|nr:DUF924 family protein [Sphingomicrobium sp.]
MSGDWRASLLKFWFELGYDRQFRGGAALDHQISQKFLKLWAEKRQLPADTFLSDPLTALAGVILFDQLPRNMFRKLADQFATDHIALAISNGAIDLGFDGELASDERAFLYMPFQHSEKLADQNRSVLLFSELGDPRYLKYAQMHRDTIARFGRFPHRNLILGRASRPDEIAHQDELPR